MNGILENQKLESVQNVTAPIGIKQEGKPVLRKVKNKPILRKKRAKRIPLTKGMFAIVDTENYDNRMKWKWSVLKGKNTWYAIRCIRSKEKTIYIYMHRLLLDLKKGEKGDHKDHNGLNNRMDNLRKCTHSQNMKNMKKPKNNTSGQKGVSKERKGWRAIIIADKKRFYLGNFKTKEEAALAYNEAAKKLHGEFAYLNTI